MIFGTFDSTKHEKIIKPGKDIKLTKKEINETKTESSYEIPKVKPKGTYEVGVNNLFSHAKKRINKDGNAYFNPRDSLGRTAEKKQIYQKEEVIKEGNPNIQLTEEEIIKTEQKHAKLEPTSWITKDMLNLK